MKNCKKNLKGLCLFLLTMVMSSCLFEASKTTVENVGEAEILVEAEKIGALTKQCAKSEIELSRLIVIINAEGEKSIADTFHLSGNGHHAVRAYFQGLAAGKQWTLTAYTLDVKGTNIHIGRKNFEVTAGATTRVPLTLKPQYSSMTAGFYPINTYVRKVELKVDGMVRADSILSPRNREGDRVNIPFDYLTTGKRNLELNVYGIYSGRYQRLWSGDSAINIVASKDISLRLPLIWCGPDSMNGGGVTPVIILGAIGHVDVHGILINGAHLPPPMQRVGCMDPHYAEYDPSATVHNPSLCINILADCEVKPGCTDPFADNYDNLARVDDGSCIYNTEIVGCLDPRYLEYDPNAIIHDSTLCLTLF